MSAGQITRRAIALVEVLVVIGTVVLLIAFFWPAATRVRKHVRVASCESNQRRLVYAALLYANDWQQLLPTRTGYLPQLSVGASPASLQFLARLPILGFDTVTVWNWETYYTSLYSEMREERIVWLGGLGFVMRDYLKNDFNVYACPDGFFAKDDFLKKWDGVISPVGPCDYPQGTTGWDFTRSLIDYRVGYLWLPHRPISTQRAGGCVSGGSEATTDAPQDIATTAADRPDLLVTADMNYFADRYYAIPGCPAKGGCGLAANHAASRFTGQPVWETACLTPVFPPNIGQQENPEQMPLGMNRARLDGTVVWLPWRDWAYYRWAFHEEVGWHSF